MHFQNQLARDHQVPYVVRNPDCASARVVPSTSNTRAEYQWRFLNQKVTGPMLKTLDEMVAQHEFDLANQVHKFCVAEASCNVTNVLIDCLFGQLVNRPIDKVRRPQSIMRDQFNTMPLIPGSLLDTPNAAREYIAQGGSISTEMGLQDRLASWPELQRMRHARLSAAHDLEAIASQIVKPFDPVVSPLLRQYILDFVSSTSELLASVA